MRLPIAAPIFLVLTCAAFAQKAPPPSFTGEVTATRLKLRAGPGEAFQPVVSAERGTRFIVLGRHPNNPEWYRIRIPGGFDAWVFGRFVSPGKDGVGTVTADKLLIRPRPSTRYHQLSGALKQGERVKIAAEKRTESGLWYRVRIPDRITLFAHSTFVKNVGPPALALEPRPAAGTQAVPERKEALTETDKRFIKLEPEVRAELTRARATTDLRPLRKAVAGLDRKELSLENRERRVKLLADILQAEHRLAILEVKRKEEDVRSDLDERLKEIDLRYKQRLAEIRREFDAKRTPRFTAMGIVRWAPDLFGRHPEYRLVEGGKMRYFLIASDFDLSRFAGKRVGVRGITDPESGTGYETIMVRRIEILGTE